MDRERAKELLPIIQAFASGKGIQLKTHCGWITVNKLSWRSDFNYRIKPEPRVIEAKDGEIITIYGLNGANMGATITGPIKFIEVLDD